MFAIGKDIKAKADIIIEPHATPENWLFMYPRFKYRPAYEQVAWYIGDDHDHSTGGGLGVGKVTEADTGWHITV
ncbi:unnamed protein product [marine sediment metagenome]|uniref:Uncharacterized protein n=1 Tax=marine sediment metagenome TaxID=412755 RepID=X1UCZ2_9ZZZZ